MDTDRIYAEFIANEYSKKTTRKVVALRKLDQYVKRPAKVFGYTFGTIMAIMVGISVFLLPGTIGAVFHIAGITGITANYPIYRKILGIRKEKYAYDVLCLAEDICDESK